MHALSDLTARAAMAVSVHVPGSHRPSNGSQCMSTEADCESVDTFSSGIKVFLRFAGGSTPASSRICGNVVSMTERSSWSGRTSTDIPSLHFTKSGSSKAAASSSGSNDR